jgi:hypothetical protein
VSFVRTAAIQFFPEIELAVLGSVSTSAVKKSVPTSGARWVRMKADQVVVRLRSVAGGRPWRWRTLPTV